LKTVIKLLLKPDKYWKDYLSLYSTGREYLIKQALPLATVGPLLSFYSLQAQEGYATEVAFLYSATTYVMDILTVIVFAFILSKTAKKEMDTAVKLSVGTNIPVWLSDVVDIYQPLRILSSLGLFYSIYLLWTGLEAVGLKKYRAFAVVLHLSLYLINAFLSELIALNPLVKEFFKNS